MATSLLIGCGLNDQKLSKLTFLREECDMDASFLVTCILGQRTKIQNTGTILICLHHGYQHYSSAGMRLGFNLSTAINKEQLKIIEPVGDLVNNLFQSDGGGGGGGYMESIDEMSILNSLWIQIDSMLKELQKTQTNAITIVIDDLSVLINLGVSERMTLEFCRKLVSLTESTSSPVSICLKLNTSNLYDLLANNLEDMANVEIQINKLKSGKFKEVDGRLVLIKRENSNNTIITKSMLYKVNDRNVKIFSPGEVGIKG